MKLTLVIQDVKSKEGDVIVGVAGSLHLWNTDNVEYKDYDDMKKHQEFLIDCFDKRKEKATIKKLEKLGAKQENIQFMTSLDHSSPELKKVVKDLINEALSLNKKHE